ncbi:hypothetical protein L1987_12874 [Smallanthus sonchifolius]|uniref:Uncharacterized protein n=1 Tax=Smallanthus sonchifolius TaxID=185202 RepID=A0ACB9JFC7_9ASTR|nr:hypothetical protein L1987_12874 [Smallanthus sonchifolius]
MINHKNWQSLKWPDIPLQVNDEASLDTNNDVQDLQLNFIAPPKTDFITVLASPLSIDFINKVTSYRNKSQNASR